MSTEIQTTQAEKPMEFIPFGAADKIRLTVKIIQNIVAVPTKSGKTCSERDAMKFMMLCQAQRLNPFAGDAFLIGYDGQSGPTFSLITAHQAMLKRAEASKDFDGMTSGILLVNESREVVEREGDFHLSEETDLVVGGWAKVYHKQRQHPTYRRTRMARFNKGFAQWKEDAAGMIVKCAEADALRSTFPTLLGGLYISEERGLATSVAEVVAARPFDAPPTDVAPLTSDENTPPDFKPLPTPQVETGSPQDKLAAMVEGAGFDFALFLKWADESGNIPDAGRVQKWREIPKEIADRLLKAKVGLLSGLKALKDDLTA